MTADGSLQAGFTDEGLVGQAAFWSADRTQGILPNVNEVAFSGSISPDGALIGGSSSYFDFTTFEDITQATLWVDPDGVVSPTQTAADYEQLLLMFADGSPVEGGVTAVTETGHAFIETDIEALVWHESLLEPIPLSDWIFAETGDIFPSTPRSVAGALWDPNRGMLDLAINGSAYGASVPFSGGPGPMVPEPGMLGMLSVGMGCISVRRRRRQIRR